MVIEVQQRSLCWGGGQHGGAFKLSATWHLAPHASVRHLLPRPAPCNPLQFFGGNTQLRAAGLVAL